MPSSTGLIIIALGIAMKLYSHAKNKEPISVDPAKSVRILTNVYMKLNFTEAKRIGIEESDFNIMFKGEYARAKERFVRESLGEFSSNLSSERLQILVNAHLEMDRKRNVQAEIISQQGEQARVKVTIAAIDHKACKEKMEAAIRSVKKPYMTQQELDHLACDALVDVYRTTEPGMEAVTFEVDCEKKTWLPDLLEKIVLLDLSYAAVYWLPVDTNRYRESLNAAVFENV